MYGSRLLRGILPALALCCLALCTAARAQEPSPGAAPPHAFGPADAPVTVEVFNDYECPACALMNEEGTPTLYVNGVELPDLPKRREIEAAIEKALPAGDAPPPDAPRFEDYPVREVYKGPAARVRLDGKMARMFRARLREGSRGGPNFAGRYTVVVWGCGTGCAQMGLVDARTGRVYFPPVAYMDIIDMEDEAGRSRWFRLDSRLLRITRGFYDGGDAYTAYYYTFDGGRFRLLRKRVERRPPPEGTEN